MITELVGKKKKSKFRIPNQLFLLSKSAKDSLVPTLKT